MKAIVLLFLCSNASAALDTLQLPVSSATVPSSLTISSIAYTNVTPTAVRLPGLSEIKLNSSSTLGDSHTAFGHLGNCSSTAISTSAFTGPIELRPSDAGITVELAEDLCLWMVSVATHAVTVQGMTRKR